MFYKIILSLFLLCTSIISFANEKSNMDWQLIPNVVTNEYNGFFSSNHTRIQKSSDITLINTIILIVPTNPITGTNMSGTPFEVKGIVKFTAIVCSSRSIATSKTFYFNIAQPSSTDKPIFDSDSPEVTELDETDPVYLMFCTK